MPLTIFKTSFNKGSEVSPKTPKFKIVSWLHVNNSGVKPFSYVMSLLFNNSATIGWIATVWFALFPIES